MKYIINSKGKTIFSCPDAGHFSGGQGLCSVKVNGKWGYINTEGQIVIPCIYDNVEPFKNGVAVVCKDNLWGVINSSGKELVPLKFKDLDYQIAIHENIICYNIGDDNNRIYQVVDILGNHLFSIESLTTFEFHEGIAIIWKNYEEGHYAIDCKGNIFIPLGKYDDILNFKNGVARVSKNKKYGFIDHKENIIVPIEYDLIIDNYGFPVHTAIKGKYHGYIDVRNGKIVFPISLSGKDDHVISFGSSDNMVCLEVNGTTFFYNLDDCNLISCAEFGHTFRFSEGLCAVTDRQTGKLGFINKQGVLEIPCLFNQRFCACEFHGATCAMDSCIIDKKGKTILSIPSGSYIKYMNQMYILKKNDYPVEEKLLTLNGKTIYTGYQIDDLNKEFPIAVKKDNNLDSKWGNIDINGNVVIPYQFLESASFTDGFATIDEPVQQTKNSRNKRKKNASKNISNNGPAEPIHHKEYYQKKKNPLGVIFRLIILVLGLLILLDSIL